MDDGLIRADTVGAGNAGTLTVQTGRLCSPAGPSSAATPRAVGLQGRCASTAAEAIAISGVMLAPERAGQRDLWRAARGARLPSPRRC